MRKLRVPQALTISDAEWTLLYHNRGVHCGFWCVDEEGISCEECILDWEDINTTDTENRQKIKLLHIEEIKTWIKSKDALVRSL